MPQSTDPGVRYPAAYGDTLSGVVHEGPADGSLIPIVVDPSLLNGNEYAVTFDTMTVEGAVETFWDLTNLTTGVVVAADQTNQSGDEAYPIVDGILFKVQGPPPGMKDWDIPNGSRRWFAYRYMRGANNPPAQPEFAPFIINPTGSYAFQEYKKSVPFAAYDTESDPPRRLMVGHLENNVTDGLVDGKYWPIASDDGDNVAGTGPREWFFIFDMDYSETSDPSLEVTLLNTTVPMMWFGTPARRGANTVVFNTGDEFQILANHINTPNDVFSVTALDITESTSLAADDVEKINVFPNPYYGVNPQEINKYERFVTINHLPDVATIRIFNLAGQLVRTIEKTAPGQFQRWDLQTDSGLPVASGLYIIYVDMPDLGKTKILKAAVIQEQQILDRY